MIVKLNFYKSEDYAKVNYPLSEIQMAYTAAPKSALERISAREIAGDFFATPITIFNIDKAVGFFVLDFGSDKRILSGDPDCILLRSFSINPQYQGMGFGNSAMLIVTDFVRDHFPEIKEIVLSVNDNNDPAYKIYLKAGFKYEGKKREGRSGPQKILTRKI